MSKRRRRPDPRHGTGAVEWRPRRLAAVAIAILAALVIVAFLRGRKSDAKGDPSAPQAQGAPEPGPAERLPSRQSEPAPVAAATVPGAVPDPPPVIDSIALEKPSVCAGEENLVTVKAHTTNGTDEFLHTVIDGNMGSSFPVRLWRDDQGRVLGQHVVTVFGRGNVATTVPLPSYEVKDCRPQRVLGIDTRVRANTWSDFDLQARIAAPLPAPVRDGTDAGAAPPPPSFVAKSYVWSFGDGETATTTSPVTSHDYERRAQKTLYSYFTITVEARPKEGEPVVGRTTLALVNPAFEAFAQKGLVTLMIALTPRFPVLGADGRVVQQVRLWHNSDAPVTIEQARRTRYYRGGVGQTAPEAIDVGKLLGATTIPPGKEGITVTVVLDAAAEPEVLSITYELAGKSSDGHPAIGSFSIMQPPPKPTASNSQPLLDPLLKAKVMAAREMLHQDVVNDEDLWRLEREGRFNGLVVPSAAASAPPPNDPARVSAAVRGPEVPPPLEQPTPPRLGPDTVPRAKPR